MDRMQIFIILALVIIVISFIAYIIGKNHGKQDALEMVDLIIIELCSRGSGNEFTVRLHDSDEQDPGENI